MPRITPLHDWFDTVASFLLSPRMTLLEQNIYTVSLLKILKEKIIFKILAVLPNEALASKGFN